MRNTYPHGILALCRLRHVSWGDFFTTMKESLITNPFVSGLIYYLLKTISGSDYKICARLHANKKQSLKCKWYVYRDGICVLLLDENDMRAIYLLNDYINFSDLIKKLEVAKQNASNNGNQR